MTGLTVLHKSDTTFIWSLPKGKPDTKIPLQNYNRDERPRVVQPSQKGPTCQLYVLHILRPRIGANPPPEFEKARKIEKTVSNFRKEITELNYHSIVSSLKEIISGLRIGSKLDDIKSMDYKKIAEMMLSDPSQRKAHRSLLSLVKFLDGFCSQSEHDDVFVYIEKILKPKHLDIHFRFMAAVGFDPKERYNQYMRKKVCAINELRLDVTPGPMRELLITQLIAKQSSWEQVRERDIVHSQYSLLAAYQAFGFINSSWTPDRSVKNLRDRIQTEGPIVVGASIGSNFYKKPAYEVQKVADRSIIGWKGSDVKLDKDLAHAVVIIGAAEGGSKGGYVYYLDPSDLTEQEIYVTSYENLTNNIHDLLGRKYTFFKEMQYPSPAGYALYHPEYVKRNTL